MDQIKKTFIDKIIFIFYFTKVSGNLIKNGNLVTEKQNVEENVCLILYSIYHFIRKV